VEGELEMKSWRQRAAMGKAWKSLVFRARIMGIMPCYQAALAADYDA